MTRPCPKLSLTLSISTFIATPQPRLPLKRSYQFLVGNYFSLRKVNATIDWHHSEMARAKIRVAVKRILKKYGYPPDLQSAAIQTVLQQAEAFSEKWAA
ncbi:DUF3387 domain-containing protein [Paracoccaceae bacterium]|nr:DUF3387 domain-containing protein [Paracoccaceae bacterium]